MLSEKPETSNEDPVAVQVNKVPVTFDARVKLVWAPEQILLFSGLFDRPGEGYTKMVKGVGVGGEQPLTEGIME